MSELAKAVAVGIKDPRIRRRANPRWPTNLEYRLLRIFRRAAEAMLKLEPYRLDSIDDEVLVQAAMEARRQSIELVIANTTPLIRKWVEDLDLWAARDFNRMLRTLAGTDLGNQALVPNLAVRAVAQKQITDQLRTYLNQTLTNAQNELLLEARRLDTSFASILRRGIRRVIQAVKRSSKVHANSLTGLALSRFDKELAERAGIRKFMWLSMRDEKVRPLHASLDGQVFSYDNPPSEGMPGEPPNCRCRDIPAG